MPEPRERKKGGEGNSRSKGPKEYDSTADDESLIGDDSSSEVEVRPRRVEVMSSESRSKAGRVLRGLSRVIS